MAQRRYLTCDRCGREIINLDRCGVQMVKEYSAKINYWGIGVPRSYSEQRIDLCDKCAEEFNKFLMMEGNTNERD